MPLDQLLQIIGYQNVPVMFIVVYFILKQVSKFHRNGIYTYWPPCDCGQQFNKSVIETSGDLKFFEYLILFIKSYDAPVLVINPTFKDLRFVDWIITDDILPKKLSRKAIKTGNFEGLTSV